MCPGVEIYNIYIYIYVNVIMDDSKLWISNDSITNSLFEFLIYKIIFVWGTSCDFPIIRISN